jgi:uncharacterized protein YukE
MADVNIVGKVSVDTGKAKKELSDLNKILEDQKKVWKNAEIGSKEYQDAQQKIKETTEKYNKIVDEQNKLNEKQVGGLGKLKEGLGGVIPGFNGAASGAAGLGKQLMLLVVNPIILVLTAIVAVVVLLAKAFNSTEENGNKLGKGLAVLNGLFSGLLKVLEPIASFLVDGLVKGFELAGDVIIKTSKVIQIALRALGLQGAATALNGLTFAIGNNIKASNQLADAEAKLQVAQRQSQRIQLDFQKQAEKLRQIRDDESNSVEKRIQVNAQLGVLLQKQLDEELRIANQSLAVADLRIKLEGQSSANLDEREVALTRISDIQERLSGQESEQLANLNGLRREQNALIKAQRDEAEAYAKSRQEEITKFNDVNQKIEQERKEAGLKKDAELFDKQKKQISDYVAAVQLTYKENAQAQKEIDAAALATKLAQQSEINASLENSILIFGKTSIAGKALAISQALINTYLGATSVLSSKSVLPSPFDFIAKAVNVAAVLASGFSSIKAITAVKVPGGGGGGSVPRPSGAASTAPVLPQQTSTSLNAASIQGVGNAAAGGVNGRSFVLDSDIKNNQERAARLQRAARLD